MSRAILKTFSERFHPVVPSTQNSTALESAFSVPPCSSDVYGTNSTIEELDGDGGSYVCCKRLPVEEACTPLKFGHFSWIQTVAGFCLFLYTIGIPSYFIRLTNIAMKQIDISGFKQKRAKIKRLLAAEREKLKSATKQKDKAGRVAIKKEISNLDSVLLNHYAAEVKNNAKAQT